MARAMRVDDLAGEFFSLFTLFMSEFLALFSGGLESLDPFFLLLLPSLRSYILFYYFRMNDRVKLKRETGDKK